MIPPYEGIQIPMQEWADVATLVLLVAQGVRYETVNALPKSVQALCPTRNDPFRLLAGADLLYKLRLGVLDLKQLDALHAALSRPSDSPIAEETNTSSTVASNMGQNAAVLNLLSGCNQTRGLSCL